MSNQNTMPHTVPSRAGFLGFALGGAALLLVVVTWVAGPFAPQQNIAISLGDFAAEAGKATLRNWFGLAQPEAQTPVWSIDRILRVLGTGLAVFAILCGATGMIRRERRDIATWAVALGISAVTLQFLSAALMIIMGTMIICALIYALGGFLNIS